MVVLTIAVATDNVDLSFLTLTIPLKRARK